MFPIKFGKYPALFQTVLPFIESQKKKKRKKQNKKTKQTNKKKKKKDNSGGLPFLGDK